MNGVARKVEKRNRPPVSCELCRTRKLKCNRSLPCDTCLKRNKADSCHYASNAVRGSNGAGASTKGRTHDFKDRLDRLETLVSSILSKQTVIMPNQKERPRSSSVTVDEGLTPATPHLQESDDGQVNYIDPSHWQSILEDIREVREHLSPTQTASSEHKVQGLIELQGSDASFLFGAEQSASLDDVLLSLLPEQPICDMLLSWYFNTNFMTLGIIHPAKFQEEYKLFWESPSKTSPLWIALLFAILSVTSALRQTANLPASGGLVPSPKTLQHVTIQLLILGRYATANAYAVESFLFHMQSCFVSSGHLTTDLWFEMGTTIRLAIRMGYHRDPGTLKGVSTFDGEMRRRVWINIVQVDALMSFHAGFPSMIPIDFCDSHVPRNLNHSDLYVDMKELPPSRPLSERTPVLYIIVKSSIMSVFKKIVHHIQLPTHASYAATLSLENEMRQAYESIPESHKRRDINRCFTDPVALILERCTVELLYSKGIIILLRRFVNYDDQSQAYTASRRACVQAALEMLDRQADISQACAPGGRLHEDRWMFSSLSVHDFLLAAMVVCLALSVELKDDVTPSQREFPDRAFKSLQSACQIFRCYTPSSRETQVAAEAIDLMVRKVSEKQHKSITDHNGMELPYIDSMSQMIDGSEIIDWSLLDQYFQDIDGANVDFMSAT